MHLIHEEKRAANSATAGWFSIGQVVFVKKVGVQIPAQSG